MTKPVTRSTSESAVPVAIAASSGEELWRCKFQLRHHLGPSEHAAGGGCSWSILLGTDPLAEQMTGLAWA